MDTSERYNKIDGLRAFSALGIVFMHVQSNMNFQSSGFIWQKLIPSFADLVFLFMVISGFSLCCGYFEKFVSGQICIEQFYKKRFVKVWPFFACLCLLDLAVSPSRSSVYEALANLTLCFGLIPNHNIEVIGVGWFLGLVFVFYFCFPFFCFLLSNKKRAWLSFLASVMLNMLCVVYFNAGRTSMAYSAVFFMAGGMIYLYRKPLQQFVDRAGIIVVLGIAVGAVMYFSMGAPELVMLMLYGLLSILALGTKKYSFSVLANPVTKWLSGVSLEIYLSHMAVFRLIEKFTRGGGWASMNGAQNCLLMAFSTITGTILFAYVSRKVLSTAMCVLKRST